MNEYMLDDLNRKQRVGSHVFAFVFGMTVAMILALVAYNVQAQRPPSPDELWDPAYPTAISVTIYHTNGWRCIYGEKNRRRNNWTDCRSKGVIVIGENIRGDLLPEV